MRRVRLASAALFAAFGVLAACDQLRGPPGKFNPNSGVIFAAERARELAHQCSRAVPSPIDGTWTPSEDQIRALEGPLVALVKQEAARGDFPTAEIDVTKYFRQYGGLVVGGKRIIHVNAFDEHLAGLSWRSEVPTVCDGGYGLFGVEYDPATKTFANFSFNGSG